MLAPASVSNLLDAWLQATAGDLLQESDEFRNPLGHALREAFPVLLDVALGRASTDDAFAPLERLMRIRAVQGLAPSQAVAFLFQLIPLLREEVGRVELQERVTRLALTAFDLYMNCREQMHTIQIKELRRGQVPA